MTKTGRFGLLLFLYGFFMLVLHTISNDPVSFWTYWNLANVFIGGALFVLDEPKEKKP